MVPYYLTCGPWSTNKSPHRDTLTSDPFKVDWCDGKTVSKLFQYTKLAYLELQFGLLSFDVKLNVLHEKCKSVNLISRVDLLTSRGIPFVNAKPDEGQS